MYMYVCVCVCVCVYCAVCMQYLFTSNEALFVGPNCGHALHPECMNQLFRSGTIKCPTCGKVSLVFFLVFCTLRSGAI